MMVKQPRQTLFTAVKCLNKAPSPAIDDAFTVNLMEQMTQICSSISPIVLTLQYYILSVIALILEQSLSDAVLNIIYPLLAYSVLVCALVVYTLIVHCHPHRPFAHRHASLLALNHITESISFTKGETMVYKACSSEPGYVRVTFELPDSLWASTVYLTGDTSHASLPKTPMRQARDGTWRATVELPVGARYRYRYQIDQCWYTEWNADAGETNMTDPHYSVLDLAGQ
jgi:hypothetical protein